MQELLHHGCSTSWAPTFPRPLPGGYAWKLLSREAAWPERVASPQTVLGFTVFSIPVQVVLSVSLGLKTSRPTPGFLGGRGCSLVGCLVGAEPHVQLGSAALTDSRAGSHGVRTMPCLLRERLPKDRYNDTFLSAWPEVGR